jgi:pSer/pThr/pTyr-binding forkhead associated (FHA) protein
LSGAEASATPEPGALRLEVVAGKAAGFTIVVDERLVIGRHSEGPGRLADDPELSRHHAQISRQPSGTYTIEDLASTNGTILNGTRLKESAVLVTGDSIEVGGTTLAVRSAPAAAASAPAGVDVRAATVIVDTPAALRQAGPPPIPAPEPPPIPAPEPPPIPAPEPPPIPTPEPPPIPTPEPPPLPAPEPEPPTVPVSEPEPPQIPVSEPEPEPEPPTVPVTEPEPPAAPGPLVTAEHVPSEDGLPIELLAGPEVPRIELRLVIDPDRGEAEVRLQDAGEPIRLGVRQGRWQVIEERP